MKVIIELEISDEQRARVTTYYRKALGEKGLPKLATRSMLRDFVDSALATQWDHVADVLNGKSN